jgi:alpha-L-arabinofuranosidase
MTHTLPTKADSNLGPLYWVAGKSDKKGSHLFKAAVYNSTNGDAVPVSLSFESVKAGTKANLTIISGPADPYAINDPYTGINVVKTSSQMITAGSEGAFSFSIPNLAVAVLETEGSSTKL